MYFKQPNFKIQKWFLISFYILEDWIFFKKVIDHRVTPKENIKRNKTRKRLISIGHIKRRKRTDAYLLNDS